jgi:5-methylcytosine-specific restriction endonuclease McrA
VSGKTRKIAYRENHIDPLQLFECYEWTCHLCHKPIDKDIRLPNKQAATIDHIIPLSRGGEHILENVRPAHASCNYNKADKLLEEMHGNLPAHIV